MAAQWTDAQLDAIRARQGTVLVSAAAGSGKTAVLVERVIERITDPEHPTDADRLLVVTFTKAAAAEMRERIERRLLDMLRENPANERLRRQQLLLQQAQICTVDSFCSSIVREFFYLVGISPDFSVVSDKQQEELMDESIQQLLGESYADPAFQTLADAISGDKNDTRLIGAVLRLYTYTRSHPFPEKWLRDMVEMLDPEIPAGETVWGKTALQYAAQALEFALRLSAEALNYTYESPDLTKAYSPALSADIDLIHNLLDLTAAGDWDAVSTAFNDLSFARLGTMRTANPMKERIKEMRERVKKEITGLQKLFVSTDAQCRAEIEAIRPLADTLARAVLRFEAIYGEKKRAKNLVDFSDLEHYALELFLRETPQGYERTETALAVAERFDEVMTDEYQDTNDAQDFLFRAVSKDNTNRFMVGDVKQSIYSFRQAMPDIFIAYKDAFPRYDREADAYPATIVLDRNFRSRKEMTESVNFIFTQLMSRASGGIEYEGDEKLAAGAAYAEKAGCETIVEFLEDLDGAGADVLEPQRIAEMIRGMMDSGFTVSDRDGERPVTYRDFCILLRSANQHAPVYAENLRALGIPAWAAVSGGFFAAGEVATVLSMLSVIDNPNQDIPLLAVMMSPIYGFTPEDMAKLRAERGEESLYVSLLRSEDPRCLRLREEIARYRILASTMPSDAFITMLCTETGFEDIVRSMPDGESRLANIRLLEKYAAEYESNGYNGISGFVRFIERLKKNRSDMESANVVSENADVVRIMSIHKSKGLEFPVCIVAGCGRRFVQDRDDMRLHPKLGLGIRLTDPETGIRYTTLPREAISIALSDSDAAEELRVFYVAMTRAREKLILLSTVKHLDSDLQRLSAQITHEERIAPYTVNSVTSISQWLMLCALRHPDGEVLRSRIGADSDCILRAHFTPWQIAVRYPAPHAEETKDDAVQPAPVDKKLKARIEEKLRFVYPYAVQTEMPTKVSASGLAAVQAQREGETTLSRPAFLGAKGMTPAERGTALHDFMQFADFAAAAVAPETELERLVREHFLTAEQAGVVDRRRVRAFFLSPLGRRILKADRVWKEQRFIADIPSGLVNRELCGEDAALPVLLQGAVDCMFEENGSLYIVDFKTDRCYDKAELWGRYGTQLKLYSEAMAQVTGKPVAACMLYSFWLNDTVEDPEK
ncbi:MAG: helicase-exonuclease AddAB subunit AddA [Clostridia bacterium]|nr:helicase-exonuclease AddAB subunit AddA [Clostridia bacterium]